MALQDLLNLSQSRKKIGLSEERINAIKPIVRQYIAYWREYPDMFIDFMQTGGNPEVKKMLELRFYQRVFLRVAARFKYVYAVYPRGYSKSFLAVLTMMIRAILYPGAKLFTSAGGKAQAAGILSEKVQELCKLVPALEKELDLRPGKTKQSKDYCYYLFKNGSFIDVLAANEKTRGKRRHAGILEECASMDGDILREILIPTMNISRMCADGTTQESEVLNQSQLYITTAGYRNTFAYEKLIAVLVQMITQPDRAFILGGTYRIPVLTGAFNRSFIADMKRDGTFNEASFDREYGSVWTGSAENAFFDGAKFDHSRVLNVPEYEPTGRSGKLSYYILSMDVGRKGCASVVCVFKVTPQAQGPAYKSLVNMYCYDDMHFEDQCIAVKQLYYKYGAKRLVIDGNGVGLGLVDYFVKSQVTEDGDTLPDFGVFNDDEGYYKKYKTDRTEEDALYIVKANAPINTEAYTAVQTQLSSGKIKLLIDERVAKNKLLATKLGQAMTPEKRNEYLQPFVYTSMLRDEIMNLKEENEGVNIILKRVTKNIRKDKFSAFCYGLYYIRIEEESKKKKKKRDVKKMTFYTRRG